MSAACELRPISARRRGNGDSRDLQHSRPRQRRRSGSGGLSEDPEYALQSDLVERRQESIEGAATVEDYEDADRFRGLSRQQRHNRICGAARAEILELLVLPALARGASE